MGVFEGLRREEKTMTSLEIEFVKVEAGHYFDPRTKADFIKVDGGQWQLTARVYYRDIPAIKTGDVDRIVLSSEGVETIDYCTTRKACAALLVLKLDAAFEKTRGEVEARHAAEAAAEMMAEDHVEAIADNDHIEYRAACAAEMMAEDHVEAIGENCFRGHRENHQAALDVAVDTDFDARRAAAKKTARSFLTSIGYVAINDDGIADAGDVAAAKAADAAIKAAAPIAGDITTHRADDAAYGQYAAAVGDSRDAPDVTAARDAVTVSVSKHRGFDVSTMIAENAARAAAARDADVAYIAARTMLPTLATAARDAAHPIGIDIDIARDVEMSLEADDADEAAAEGRCLYSTKGWSLDGDAGYVRRATGARLHFIIGIADRREFCLTTKTHVGSFTHQFSNIDRAMDFEAQHHADAIEMDGLFDVGYFNRIQMKGLRWAKK